MPITTQQSAETDADMQSSGDPTDPLFYPSWYKVQPRQTSNLNTVPGNETTNSNTVPGNETSNSNTVPVAENRQVGPSVPVEVNVKKTETATANGSPAVSGKEANIPTATSQVSI